MAVDIGFAIFLYVVLTAIAVPSYLLVDRRRASRKPEVQVIPPAERTSGGNESEVPPAVSPAPHPPLVEAGLPVLSVSPGSAIVGVESPSFTVNLVLRLSCTVQPSVPSDMRLESIAKGIGVDVKSLQMWVDEQRRKSAGDDRQQVMYRIMSNLETPRSGKSDLLGR